MERAEIAREGAGGGIPMVCDLADMKSIRTFADDCKAAAPTLDVLCLNAAVAPSTKAEVAKRTVDGFEEAIGVNHLGHSLLAALLQPHLTAGPTKRLVVTASSVHDPDQPGGAINGKSGATLGDLSGFGATSGPMVMCDGATEYDGSKVYKDSKLCNMLFCREAQKRWGATGKLSIRSFSPGFIPASGLFREPRKDNWLAATAFAFAAEKLLGFAVPIDVGGDRLAYLATASDEAVPSGSYLSAPTGAKGFTREEGFDDGLISAEASDDAKAAKLWELTAAAVGLA
jgi:light-dependent protochlorophyllide reductase